MNSGGIRPGTLDKMRATDWYQDHLLDGLALEARKGESGYIVLAYLDALYRAFPRWLEPYHRDGIGGGS